MNVFKIYLEQIKKKILKNKSLFKLTKIDLLNITLEKPPENYDYDFSTNAALVLSKKLNSNTRDIAQKLKKLFIKEIKDFSKIDIAGPGFINIKLNNKSWIKNINLIFKNKKKFGSNKSNLSYNVEFVSANPTGPLHIGHCRGAVFGDVISKLLTFNGNKVIREFYVNDFGNQINIFAESVFFRLRELKFKEKFPLNKNLYPGSYIINIAKSILFEKPKINLDKFEDIKKELSKNSINFSMKLIKSDLKLLGIKHDNFFYESEIVKKKLIYKSLNKLKKKRLLWKDI